LANLAALVGAIFLAMVKPQNRINDKL
jgi:hypothetical protein